jgi:hypothetical protein
MTASRWAIETKIERSNLNYIAGAQTTGTALRHRASPKHLKHLKR